MSDSSQALLGVGGCSCLGLVIFVIVVLASIKRIGPEEQVVYTKTSGNEVKNGPFTEVIWPHQKHLRRPATRLGPREYAIVKNTKSGIVRHEIGPMLLFIGAYDELQEKLAKVVLQKIDYIRLVDTLVGTERVIRGPKVIVPEPMEEAKKGVEQAIIVEKSTSVLVLNRTSGDKKMIVQEGVFIPEPYQDIIETRQATLLSEYAYATVKNHLNGQTRNEEGPKLLKIGPYDEVLRVSNKTVLDKTQYVRLLDAKDGGERLEFGPKTFVMLPSESAPQGVQKKIVLEKDEYIRFVDSQMGTERVVRGPDTVVPRATENSPEGTQSAVFLNDENAVLLLNRTTGQQSLYQGDEVFVPSPYERILEVRKRIRILPHEALVVRRSDGKITVHDGRSGGDGESFFLPPYSGIVTYNWSSFADPTQARGSSGKVPVSVIDLRARKMYFDFEVRTSDNVKLRLKGTIFWQVLQVPEMVNKTSDPEGDVWHHARSGFIQAVSQSTLDGFMKGFNNITEAAFAGQRADGFYSARGVELQSMEVTGFDCVDPETATILQNIIKETTNQINRLQAQQSENAVKAAKLQADIKLEEQRSELIEAEMENSELEAQITGVADGTKVAQKVSSFINGLNHSLPDIDERVNLYKMHEEQDARNTDTLNLASGNAKLFLTPSDLNLRLDMSGSSGPEL